MLESSSKTRDIVSQLAVLKTKPALGAVSG
jgi:hypothetical protein